MGKQQIVLKQHADAPRLGRQGGEQPLAEPYLPRQPDRPRGQHPRESRQQGALAAAARAHQGQHLAGGHRQGGQRQQGLVIQVEGELGGMQHDQCLSAGLIRRGSQSTRP